MRKHTTITAALTAVTLGTVAALTGCSAGSSSANGPITLTVQTFGQFGYETLYKQYEKAHPNITIKATTVAGSADAENSINTHLAANNGMPDVVAVESGFLANEMQYPTKWLPVADSLKTRWLDWKSKPATDKDGKIRFYGVDAGPTAVCYNSDLVKKAGFPTDPTAFASKIGNTWESYYAAGKEYAAKTGLAWFDSADSNLAVKLTQIQNAFENNDGSVIATTNPEVKAAFTSSVEDYSQLSAKLQPFSTDWNTGIKNQKFATIMCPSWMVGVLQAGGPDVKGWNVANTLPGGAANRGGSYLGVSTQTKYPTQAQALAAWLTAPAQEIAAFKAVGSFPSQVEALTSPTLLDATSSYASGAPTGKIFGDRAKAITTVPFRGIHFQTISTYLEKAVFRVEDGSQSATASFAQFQSDVKQNVK